jgi:succinate dehydrogenase / fumarate reductase, iron-sulfur subunit
MEPFFAGYRSIKPYLIADDPPHFEERRQSIAQRERYDDTSKCILCAACTSACPITWPHTGYVGPAAIVNAHRFIFDSRDQGAADRMRILNDNTGVWRCRTIFNCTEVCPRGIQVEHAIGQVKLALVTGEVT